MVRLKVLQLPVEEGLKSRPVQRRPWYLGPDGQWVAGRGIKGWDFCCQQRALFLSEMVSQEPHTPF